MPTPTPGFRLAIRDLSPLGTSPQQFMSDRWTVEAVTELPGFPATKLQTDLLSDYWSAYNARSSNTWITAVSDDTTGASTTRNLGLIAVLGLNRRTPSALLPGTSYTPSTVRFRVDSFPFKNRIRPPCTLSSRVNLSGLDTDFTSHPLDPPDDPAPVGYVETKLTPTSSIAATSLIATFGNAYATERALSGTQTFRVHLCDVNNPTQIPNATVAIYQSGVLVSTLSSPTYEHVTVANSSGGFIFTYTFLASSLTSQTAALQMHISTTTACDFIGTELVLNLTGHLYDSGVETFTGVDTDAFAERLDLTLNTGVTYVHVEFGDFCSYTTATYTKTGGGTASANTYTSIVAPGDSDGRLHVGRFLAADAIVFPINGTGGYNLQAATNETTSSGGLRTRSGAARSTRSLVEWTEMDLSIIRVSRVLKQLLMRQKAALGLLRNPTLLVPDPLMTEGYTDEETRPRWVLLSAVTETHAGRMSGVDSDAYADNSNHIRDHWDVNMHLLEHSGALRV